MPPPMCLVSSVEGWGLDELLHAVVGQLTYIHTCMHTYIHACTHACIHTYVHTYVHTCELLHAIVGELSASGGEKHGGARASCGEAGGDEGGEEGCFAAGASAGSAEGPRRGGSSLTRRTRVVSSGGSSSGGSLVDAAASGERCGAIVIETAMVRGVGMTMSVVVRAGMLRPDDWFVVGATCGKVRTLSPLQAGSGQAAVARGLKEFVNEASSGMAVRVSVAWKNDKDMGNGFDVGDSLHVLSPADALHIARYRAHRDTFLLLRTPWEEAQRSRLMRVPLLKDRKRLLQLRMRCLDGSGRLLPAGSTDATHDELAAVWVAELDKAASAMVPQEEVEALK